MSATLVTRVVNRREPFDVYIGRGSEWGNDWSHLPGTKAKHVVATRDEAIECYRRHLWERIASEGTPLIEKLAELHGKTLGCYCAPKPCHGDVLAAAAEWATRELGRLR